MTRPHRPRLLSTSYLNVRKVRSSVLQSHWPHFRAQSLCVSSSTALGDAVQNTPSAQKVFCWALLLERAELALEEQSQVWRAVVGRPHPAWALVTGWQWETGQRRAVSEFFSFSATSSRVPLHKSLLFSAPEHDPLKRKENRAAERRRQALPNVPSPRRDSQHPWTLKVLVSPCSKGTLRVV